MSHPAATRVHSDDEVIAQDQGEGMDESSSQVREGSNSQEEEDAEGSSRQRPIGIDDEAAANDSGRRPVQGGARAPRDFRVQGKQFALTYPQCPVERAEFDPVFKAKFKPVEFASARELHKDGEYHLHVFVAFGTRRNVQSARYFDVSIKDKTYHPNTQKCKDRKKWLRYISKDGDHGVDELCGGGDVFDIMAHELGKRKGMFADHQFTQQYLLTASLKPIEWPITLSCEGKEYRMEAPEPKLKKRNWWIVAPPNAGKTRWINKTFARTAIYCPRTGKYPYEGYSDQQLIIYDDRTKIAFEEFSDVLNTWEFVHPVFGEVRFRTQDWKLGQTRNVIVLSNKTIEESLPEEDWVRMKKRFIQIVNPVLIPPQEMSDDEMPAAQEVEEEHKASDYA
nr:MAG: replication associated protein [Cressdnaviricota sp.]